MVEVVFRFSARREIRQHVSDGVFWWMLGRLDRSADPEEVPSATATMAEVESWHLARVLRRADTAKEAAQVLGVSRSTLQRRRRDRRHSA